MRVPDLLIKSIGFVAEVLGPDLSPGSLDPIATTFLVSIPTKIHTGRFFYAITARHVFSGTPDVKTVVIVNSKGGGVTELPILGEWHHHPDPKVDVSATPVKYDPSMDVSAFDIEDCFDESHNPENIGLGDEVFFAGLFTPAPGISRITPIVRHGNLAMLPCEQIQTAEGYADVYLIEARSIGGISGSPVFVRETLALPVSRDGGEKCIMQGIGKFKLLGIVQGHWDVDESMINQAYISHARRGVNLGIAKVIPAKKIIETINGPGLRALREEELRRFGTVGSLD